MKSDQSTFFSTLKDDITQLSEMTADNLLFHQEQEFVLPEDDLLFIIDLINRIPKIEERLLVKLKFYCQSIPFAEEEESYIAARLNAPPGRVLQILKEMNAAKKEGAIGIRNSDICRILKEDCPELEGDCDIANEKLLQEFW